MKPLVLSDKMWSISFVHLLIFNAVNIGAFGMTMPITPSYIVTIGASMSLAGTATGIFSISALCARFLAGILGDKFNKKRLLMVTMLINGVVVVLYTLASDIIFMVIIRILHGIIFSVNATVFYSLGSYYIPPKRLSEGMSYLSFGQTIGMALGPSIGIYLLKSYTYDFCFIVSGICIIIAGISISTLQYSDSNFGQIRKYNDNLATKKVRFRELIAVDLLPNAFFVAILTVSSGLNTSYLTMLGDERNIDNIGLYFSVHAIILLVLRPIIGKFADKGRTVFVVASGFILMMIALMFISFSHKLWMVLLAAILIAMGGGAIPVFQADCLKKVDHQRKTVATGTYYIGVDTGMCISQILGGIIISLFGCGVVYSLSGVLMFIGFGLYLFYCTSEKKRVNNNC